MFQWEQQQYLTEGYCHSFYRIFKTNEPAFLRCEILIIHKFTRLNLRQIDYCHSVLSMSIYSICFIQYTYNICFLYYTYWCVHVQCRKCFCFTSDLVLKKPLLYFKRCDNAASLQYMGENFMCNNCICEDLVKNAKIIRNVLIQFL